MRHFFIQRLFVASFTFLRTKFCEINPTNTVSFSPEPRAKIHCLQLNFKISKLAYSAGRKKNPHSVQKDKGLTLLHYHCQKLVRLNRLNNLISLPTSHLLHPLQSSTHPFNNWVQVHTVRHTDSTLASAS